MRAFRSAPADALRLALLAALGLPCWLACGTNPLESADPDTHTGGAGNGPSTGGSHSDGGGVSTGGTVGVGGSGVGGTTSFTLCSNIQPLLPGYDTGFYKCDEGFEHRSEAKECPSFLPRTEPLPPTGTGGQEGLGGSGPVDECLQDSDCPGPHGYCERSYVWDGSPANYCQNGCVTDSDCGENAICRCGNPIGTCVATAAPEGELGCRTDEDCPELYFCAAVPQEYGCGGLGITYACQTSQDQCKGNADCDGYENCAINWNGSLHRECQSAPVCGRPFLVDFMERRAECAERGDWTQSARTPELTGLSGRVRAELAAHWTDIALMEHASIAAFARFSLQLLALGAPADLIEETNRALTDETKHARLCFALASSYGGAPVGPGRLDIAGSLEGATPEAILRTVIHEGCIGETHAALEAAESRALCGDRAVSEVLEVIARDEARHAELAWRFVQWLVTERPELRAAAESEFAAVFAELAESREAGAAPGELGRYGVLDTAERRAVRRHALESVVAPCAASLLRVSTPPHTAGAPSRELAAAAASV